MKSENLQHPEAVSRRRDPKIFILFGILALILLVWMFGNRSHQAPLTVSSSTGKKMIKKQPAANDPVSLFVMLQQKQPEFQSEKRNIFNFHQPPPPPPAAVPAEEQTEMADAQPDPVCGNQICETNEDYQNCPTDCQPPPPPDIPLRYIGYLSENEGAIAFLTDGKEIYMGKENDIIANRYRIQKITDQNVELGYLNMNQSRSIPFQGNNEN